MSRSGFGWTKWGADARSIRRWACAAQNSPGTELATLKKQRSVARRIRAAIDRFLHVSETRLARSRTTDLPVPHSADWGWRPDAWQASLPGADLVPAVSKSDFGANLTLFHDCPLNELALRQLRATAPDTTLAPWAVQLDVLGFDGSFLSLVLDLPTEAVTGLSRDHILSLNCDIEMESPLEVFARLNIRCGPNTEQIVQEFPQNDGLATIEFDLAYSQLNERRVEAAWIDLIFESPRMNRIVLRDLYLSRHPRARL